MSVDEARVTRYLDSYYGRHVTKVTGKTGSWSIWLIGEPDDVRIVNEDGVTPVPDLPKGYIFLSSDLTAETVTFGIFDDQSTTIEDSRTFTISAVDYSIYDSLIGEKPFKPAFTSIGDVNTPPEPTGRSATGPA